MPLYFSLQRMDFNASVVNYGIHRITANQRGHRVTMQADVKHSIIHQFYTNDGQIGLRFAHATMTNDEAVNLPLSELTDVYHAKPSKGYARFINPEHDDVDTEQLSEFPPLLQAWRKGEDEFVTFSQRTAQILHQQLQHYGFLESGFLLIASYLERGHDHLVVAFLPNKEGVAIAPDLSVDRSSLLDINRVFLAATINLSEWQEEPESTSYISFLKGRVGRKIADFFLDFLGCTEGYNVKKQTQQLVETVQNYVQEHDLEPAQAQAVRQSVYEICDTSWKNDEPVRVADLSEQLAQAVTTGQSFADYTATLAEPLPEELRTDRSTVRKLVKFQGQGVGLSVGFDQQLLGERVEYHPATDTLTIRGTPPNLRDQLRRYFGIDS